MAKKTSAVFESRKLMVLAISVVAFIVNDYFGSPISRDGVQMILAAVASWLVAQGIADAGAQGSVRAAEKATRKKTEVAKDDK